jgi:hypothetical protein
MNAKDAPGESLGRQDLGSVFRPRSAGLAGQLQPQAVPPPTPQPEPPTPPAEETTTPTQPKQRKASARTDPNAPTAPRTPGTTHHDGNQNYPVYLPSILLEAFKHKRDQMETTNTLLVFDAIDAIINPGAEDPYARFCELVQQSLIASPSATTLFDRGAPQRVRSRDQGPRSQLMLRMSPSNQRIIEQLIDKTGATDRGHLITVALTAYLAPRN